MTHALGLAHALALSLAVSACGGLLDDGDEKDEPADGPSEPAPVCEPGERRCNGAVIQECADSSDEASWIDVVTCASEAACTPERCRISPEPCKPDTYRCNGANREQCQQNRTWSRIELCTDAAACHPDGCVTGGAP